MSCQLPDPFHVKRDYAEDLATEVVTLIQLIGAVVLYIDCSGTVYVSARGPVDAKAFDLVGSYTAAASVHDITEDILAMQRERIDGKADET